MNNAVKNIHEQVLVCGYVRFSIFWNFIDIITLISLDIKRQVCLFIHMAFVIIKWNIGNGITNTLFAFQISPLGLIINWNLRICFLFFTFSFTSHNFHYCTLLLSSGKLYLFSITVSVNAKNSFPFCFQCPQNESFSINHFGLFYVFLLFHLGLFNNSTFNSSFHFLILSFTITFHFI